MPHPDEIRDDLRNGYYAKAEYGARQCLADTGSGHPDHHADVRDLLVEALWRGGKAGWSDSLIISERALKEREENSGSNLPIPREKWAHAITNLALVHYELGSDHYPSALELLRKALRIREDVKAQSPVDPDRIAKLAWSLTYLALILEATANEEAAKQRLSEARQLFEGLPNDRKDHRGHSLCLNLQALLLHDSDYRMATSNYAIAEKLRRAFRSGDPPHPEVGGILNNHGALLQEFGDLKGAEVKYREALEIRLQLGGHHPRLADTRYNLGLVLWLQGEKGHARPILAEAKDGYALAYGTGHERIREISSMLGDS